jgi:hypothetical protein
MATAYTSLLGLALPVTGELSGSWGDTVNQSITSLLDTAISGTTSITTDADITLTTTTGVANEARQAIILWNPASGTVTRNITAPAQSKIYTVINASGGTQSIVFRGAGPTTGVTIVKGESAVVAWNGTDFIKISNAGGSASFTNVTVSGTTTLSGLTASTALALDASKNVVSVTNTGTGNNVLATSPTLVTPALGTPSSATLTNATGLPISTGVAGLGAGVSTFLATPSSANLATAVTDETGTGALVFATSPTLVTPALGTPSALVGTNITGTAAGLTAGNVTTNANLTGAVTSVGNATSLGSFSSANLAGALTDETGTGSAVFATSPTLVTPLLGTPTSVTLTNATGLPVATGISGLGTGVATFLATPSSANLAAAVTDETGTGALVFANSPTLVTPALGTPSSVTLTNATGLPVSTGISGLGTGVATALAVNVGTAGAPVINGGVLGTPSSGTVTNLTGTASININGTVGATTASTGAFTTLTTSSTVTLNGGTANGVAYLNASKVLTTGSALTFDGSVLTVNRGGAGAGLASSFGSAAVRLDTSVGHSGNGEVILNAYPTGAPSNPAVMIYQLGGSEQMRLTSTGLGIGTSSPTNKLSVAGNANVTGNTTLGDAATNTVTVNGYMGVGGAASSNIGFRAINSALTGNSQYGIVSAPVATSAATSLLRGFAAFPATVNAAFTTSEVSAFYAAGASKGASNTITNLHGLYVADQTQGTNNFGIKSEVSSGTNKWNIYASGTAQNYFAGNVQFAAGSAAAPALTRFGDDNTGIFFPAADTIAFSVGGAESMRINSAGNLGLGVNPSAWGSAYKPVQMGNSNFSGAVASFIGNAQTFVTSNAYHNGTNWIYINTNGAAYYRVGGVGSDHIWFTAPSGTAGNAISFTQAMSLLANGNFLVGTTTDEGERTRFESSSAAQLALVYPGIGKFSFKVDSGRNLSIIDGTTERARIDSSGNLIQTVNTTAATLSTNGTLTFSIVDNSTLRISVRGSDGTTRTATVALT